MTRFVVTSVLSGNSRWLTGTDGCEVSCSTLGGIYKAVMMHRENGENLSLNRCEPGWIIIFVWPHTCLKIKNRLKKKTDPSFASYTVFLAVSTLTMLPTPPAARAWRCGGRNTGHIKTSVISIVLNIQQVATCYWVYLNFYWDWS